MHKVSPPLLAKHVMYTAIWNFSRKDNSIYLTFDDGPTKDVTIHVLDILKKYSAQATFFCLGKNIVAFPEVYQQIIEDGHAVGNHSHSHKNGWKTSDREYYADIQKADEIIYSSLFRPPYGKLKPSQYTYLKKKYTIILWDVLSGDYKASLTGEKCYENVIKHTKPGSVIVFHDSLKCSEKVIYALPKVLEHFLSKGFTTEKITLVP